jgi:hypothetical protein
MTVYFYAVFASVRVGGTEDAHNDFVDGSLPLSLHREGRNNVAVVDGVGLE